MHLGIVLRNMGPRATREFLANGAEAAEAAGLDSVWVTDHLAIPPDDAEGSEGRYLDPLATLAFLAGRTSRIGLGTGVLILPYRPALPTAKWVATVQELSGGRLLLGVGIGWMKPEFRALGVPRAERGARSDDVLDFLTRALPRGAAPADGDVVERNGQPFLFRPRPAGPPVFVGGAPPHAIARARRFGAGWMPMGGEPEALAPHIAILRDGNPDAPVALMTALPTHDVAAARARRDAYAEVGVTHLVQGTGRVDESGFRAAVDALATL
jgi:probable F420-dependent oxidoreductase